MRAIRASGRWLRWSAPAAVAAFAACSEVPESTESARGILSGANVVLALSMLFVVGALLLIAMAIGVDRYLRTRRALSETPPDEEVEAEEEDEVVAGIVVGRAPVPRWLYGAYVLIPVFAFAYLVSNISPPATDADEPAETPQPTGPVTEVTVVARQIVFTVDTLTFPANTEITATLDNQDVGVPHDLTFWDSDATQEQFATTGTIGGGATGTVTWTTPDPGTYYFNCTIHPASMTGDVEVVEG